MNAYSTDLRQKIVAAYKINPNKSQIAKIFGVSLNSVKRYVQMEHTTGSLEAKPRPGRKATITKEQYPELEKFIQDNPDATLEELGIRWGESHPCTPTVGTLSHTLKRMKWSYKKKVKSLRTQ
jgi:transposase